MKWKKKIRVKMENERNEERKITERERERGPYKSALIAALSRLLRPGRRNR